MIPVAGIIPGPYSPCKLYFVLATQVLYSRINKQATDYETQNRTKYYWYYKRKVLPEPDGPWGGDDLHFLSPQPDTSVVLRNHGYGASVSRGVPVYSPAFAGTHCAYIWRDG